MNFKKVSVLTCFIVFMFSFVQVVHAEKNDLTKNKVSQCLGCHGSTGNSRIPTNPSLAAQSAMYIQAQLQNFQSGKRISPIMQNMAANLSKQDIKEFSRYFSKLKPKSSGSDKSALVKAGQAKIAMCQGCHGSSLEGRGGFPRLAGQQPEYLKKQLLNFKNRSRKGGPMNAITASFSEQDINELAAYLGSL